MNDTAKSSGATRKDSIAISDELAKKLELHVHLNLTQEVIITTEDKLKICLAKHCERIDKRRGWIAPLGILIAIILTLITSEFKDMGLNKYTWEAIFIICAIIVFFWLVISLWLAWTSKTNEDIISELKKESEAHMKKGLGPEELRVLKAVYGTGSPDKETDVTNQLRDLISNGRLNVTASNILAGDPDPGKRKNLEVIYEYNGEIEIKRVTEGDVISLP
ncbi:MAG: hypothetical protein WC880_05130 [Candidatus Paceibacterota bacterium]